VWEHNGVIKYRARSTLGWGSIDNVSTSNAQYPSLEIEGSNVYVVWSADRNIYWRYATYIGGNHSWSRYMRVDDTNDPSQYPVLTSGHACAWMDEAGNNDEIYLSYYDPVQGAWAVPINISTGSDELYSKYPHIVHKQVPDVATKVYFVWTEGSEDALEPTAPPYKIKFKQHVIWESDAGQTQALPFYIAEAGEQHASPFNRHRTGYLQYSTEPYERIDYDTTYLEYAFANLDPRRQYCAEVYLYQHGSSNLALAAQVDDYQLGTIKLPQDTLMILGHMIPPAFYVDSMLNIKIFGNNAVTGIIVLYEYESEPRHGGVQSAQDMSEQRVLSLSILPNPARGIVNVSYTLAAATNVELSLFDVTGRLIEHLVYENQASGTFHKTFSNANLSQGVYFVRLHTSDETLTEKVIFLK
jgi:hypothetical protein